jgi:hypothetical protein
MSDPDLLRGAAAIAAFLGTTPRRAFHICTTSQIPAFKIGGLWHARRTTLQAFFAEREARAMRRVAEPAGDPSKVA